jgi:hypothetical protein
VWEEGGGGGGGPDVYDDVREWRDKCRHELVPSYTEFTYEMKGYGGLGEGVVYSQAENVNGVEWRLKVYPRGNGKARGAVAVGVSGDVAGN